MSEQRPITIFWFRRDLRLHDNTALQEALKSGFPVLAVFIFDSNILDKLESKEDTRVSFIYDALENIHRELLKSGSSLLVEFGDPVKIWKQLLQKYKIRNLFFNHDYEPYAINRDKAVTKLMTESNVQVKTCKDHVIFEKDEILSQNGNPYTVYTPYKSKWLEKFLKSSNKEIRTTHRENNFLKCSIEFPDLSITGFRKSKTKLPDFQLDKKIIKEYTELRNYPAIAGTSKAGIHLRFGTISVRELAFETYKLNDQFISELAWRDFFIQILYHFPHVEHNSFRKEYDFIKWRNDESEFDRWKNGETGYPLVDAGMRELNTTGFMHNRVRMVTASFLCKHLLIDWRWGESYFASRLLDYELASNNGNWQWSAGCGCDAAPYFRIFNPHIQLEKFDTKKEYVRRWVPEFESSNYQKEIIEHAVARERALKVFREGLRNN